MALNQVQKKAIIPNEAGILSQKGRGFHFPSDFAGNHLIHLLWSDEFICDENYKVNRESLACYELFNIVQGKMTVRTGGKTYTATDGNLVFLDLRFRHYYKADTVLQVQQYLIEGAPLQAYYQLLTEKNGPVFQKDSRISFQLSSLKNETMKKVPNDHLISYLLVGVLTSLSLSAVGETADPIRQARYYIADHYRENISLDDIAAAVSLSKYYFSRRFEKETGSTPWEYLTETRIRNSMQLLTHSYLTVDEIAMSCGFSDATYFIRTFKKLTGFTPGVFRRYFFDVTMGFEDMT